MTPSTEARPSGIEGLGLFAVGPAAAGSVLGWFTVERVITSDAPLRPDLGEKVDHLTYPDGKVLLLAAPERYVNHSCDPNAWERHSDRGIEIVARRALVADEEVTIDYLVNNAGGNSWDCACGATRCRGTTGFSFFDLPASFREEYRPLLAPWFVDRHRDRL